MGQALYRKWRPQTFDDVVGQEHIVRTLRHALRSDHFHHAYLLAGPRGTGKTTTARLIAKAVNCRAAAEERPCDTCEICRAISEGRLLDLNEIDAASNTGVDNIRELLEKVNFRPTQAPYKVYVIDEVHMLSTAAFNALLKTLEEPPEHVIFVLATTEVHKIPETILSRCQRFEFRRIPLNLLVSHLQKIAETESIAFEMAALELIARAATGSMRDAISLFDQMSAGGDVTADYVRLMLGAERRDVVQSLLQAWVDADLHAGLEVINRAIDGGADPRQLARQTADFLRGLLLMRLGTGSTWADPTEDERPRFEAMAKKASPAHLVNAVRLFSAVAANRRSGWQPQMPLELAFVEATLNPVAPAAVAPAAAPQPAAAATPSPAQPQAQPVAAAAEPTRRARNVTRKARMTPQAKAASARAKQQSAPTEPVSAVSEELTEQIQTHWSDFVGRVQPVSIGALLRGAKVVGSDSEGRLVLTFQHAFHREKIDQDVNRHKVEDTLNQMFKQRVSLRCVLEKEWAAQPPKSAAPSSKSAPPQPAARTSTPPPPEPPPLEDDELVLRAQEELGAVPKISD